jgi:hypothetical protein
MGATLVKKIRFQIGEVNAPLSGNFRKDTCASWQAMQLTMRPVKRLKRGFDFKRRGTENTIKKSVSKKRSIS